MELKELIEKKGRFSKDEIDYIIAEGAKFGIMPPKRTKCQNCWRDMAIEVAYAQREAKKNKPRGRHLRGSAARHGVLFRGRLITNETLTPDLLRWMDENGFPKTLLIDED